MGAARRRPTSASLELRLANQAWLMSVHFVAKDLVKPKPTTWLGRTVSGSRNTLTAGLQRRRRARDVLDVLLAARTTCCRWRARHGWWRTSRGPIAWRSTRCSRPPRGGSRAPRRPATDVVSLFLESTEALTPQVLRVEFGYFSRLQSWGPILIPALFFALGNAAGALVRGFAERLTRRLSGWLQLGRQRASAAEVDTGTVIPRDRLRRHRPRRDDL
jgi:hypothetical protein